MPTGVAAPSPPTKPASVSPIREYERAPRLSQVIRSLLQRAQAGDPDAAVAVYMAIEECRFLKTRIKPAWLARNPDDPALRPRLDAYNKRQSRCEGLQNIPELWLRPEQYRDLAAEAGHPVANAMWLPELRAARREEGAQALALSLISQLDARSVPYLYVFVSGRNGGPVIGDPPQRFDPRTYEAAWIMSACRLGLPCEGDSRLLRDICIDEGRCGYAGYEDSVRQMLGPAQYGEALTLRDQIVDALRNRRLAFFGLVPKAPATKP